MRGKSIALLMLALGCGLIASLGITQIMSKRPAETPEGPAVCVAAQDISPGETVSAQSVKLQAWPVDKIPLPLGAIMKIEDADGRQPQQKIFAGDLILDKKLYARGVKEQMADSMIPKGYRVIAVKVSDISTSSGLVMPGSRVDIQVFMQRNPDQGIPCTMTRTLLQGIKVFAVNDVTTVDSSKGDKSIRAATVSFLVTPSQGEKLHLASELGTIRLAMRSPAEDAIVETNGEQAANLFRTGGAPPDGPTTLGVDAEKQKLLDELRAAQAKLAARATGSEAPAPDKMEHWKFRCLKPGQVNDIVLERPALDGSEPQSASPALWRVSSMASTAPPTAADKGAMRIKEPPPAALPTPAQPADAPSPLKKLLQQIK